MKLQITRITEREEGRAHRVEARAGMPVWFESTDVRLRPSPEAFGSALLLSGLGLRKRLKLEDAVSPVWYGNVEKLLPIFHEWWGLPEWMPEAAVGAEAKEERRGGAALCFSGGVDSFYTLLRGGRKVEWLVSLHGFDIPLRDAERMAGLEKTLREVAGAVGARAAVVRTNVRQHWGFRWLSWEWTHGGMLAAVGHLLSDFAGELLISSSLWPNTDNMAWGSHSRTDPLWSSERASIIHQSPDIRRDHKLHALATEPLVQRHLRVCWENRARSGNCSRCEKCVRTRIFLADCGQLEHFTTFAGEASLAADIDRLPYSMLGLRLYFQELIERGNLNSDVKAALRRLNARTEKVKQQRWRGAIKRVRGMGAYLLRLR